MQRILERLSRLGSRYPVVRQYDRADCGPAALLSVLRFWGGDASLPHVRELAGTDTRGSSMLGLVRAARELGFEARGAAGSYDDLLDVDLPCIAHVVNDEALQHFAVIYRADARGVLLGDPGRGRWKMAREDFLRIWKKNAVILLTPTDRLHNVAPPHWLRWIISYFKREETWLYQSIFLGLVYTFLGLLTSVFVQWLIDRFIPEARYSMIVATGVALTVLQLLRPAAGYLRQRFLIELSKRVNVQVNEEFLSHIFRLPVRFFHTRKTGDITSRIQDAIRIQNALLLIFGTTVVDGLVIVGALGFMLILAPQIGWIASAVMPVYAVILLLASRRIKEEHHEVLKSYAQVESSYIDSLDGIEEVSGYFTGGAFSRLNTLLYRQFQDGTERLGKIRARVGSLAELAGGILVTTALVVGAVLVTRDALLLGEMMAAYSLLGSMIPATNRLVEANIALQGASVAAMRLMDLLLVDAAPDDGTKRFELHRALSIQGGHFAWPRGGELLRGIDLTIEVGRLTGLWGPSGSGKTTLVKVLQRAYALNEGAVLVDAASAEEFDLASYRRNIAVVPETVKVFNGTVADNILIGREAADPQALLRGIEWTGLGAVLERFEAGLATPLGEDGRHVSAGERQVIGLLRALFDEPSVLIMDEGISAIDVRIAAQVLDVLERYARTHAVLLISHDLHTLSRSDFLYVLEDGRISDCGPPRRLLEDGRVGRMRVPGTLTHA